MKGREIFQILYSLFSSQAGVGKWKFPGLEGLQSYLDTPVNGCLKSKWRRNESDRCLPISFQHRNNMGEEDA